MTSEHTDADIGSDHNLAIAKIKIKLKAYNTKNSKQKAKKLNLELLNDENIRK